MRGQRHEDLHRDRAEPDQEGEGEKTEGLRASAEAEGRDDAEREHGQDQPAVLEEIAERHHEEQAEAVADLGERDDQPGLRRRQAELGTDQAEQRLGEIEVGGDQAAGGGDKEGDPARARGGCGLVVIR